MSDGQRRLDYTSSTAGDDGRNSFIVGVLLIVVDSSAWAFDRMTHGSEWLYAILVFAVAWLLSLLFGIWGVLSGVNGLQESGNGRRYAVVGLVINAPIAVVAIYYAARSLGIA